MAHVLSSIELDTQRARGQWSKTYLAIPQYHTIFSAQLDDVPTSNDNVSQVNFKLGSGTIANVLPDMTLYVGTTAGGYEIGFCRIRKTTTMDDSGDGIFYIGRTSEIEWNTAGTVYLTVVDDFSPWQKPINGENGRMDEDVTYSDQNSNFAPVVLMGAHRVKKLTGASVSIELGESADVSSWVIGSTISSRSWSLSGGTLDDATKVNPVATFTQAGTYLAYCTVTAANGKTSTGVRYVIIWDDEHPLISNFTFSNGRYSADDGGFDVTLYQPTARASIRKRSLAILCTEDYADGSNVTMPGKISGCENILACGRISDINVNQDSESGEISFTVKSDAYWIQQMSDYPLTLKRVTGTPAGWSEMSALNLQRALFYILQWRSNIMRITDVQIEPDTHTIEKIELSQGSIWSGLQEIGRMIFAAPIVDMLGRLFIEIDPQMTPTNERDFPSVMAIEESDIKGGLNWVLRDTPPLSLLHFSGTAYNTSGASVSYFSLASGHAYGHLGVEESVDGALVSSQQELNDMCARYIGWKNRIGCTWDDFEIEFAHSMRALDIAPRQYCYFELDDHHDPRGDGFAGNVIPREISFSQSDTGFISFAVLFEPETSGGLSVTTTVPGMDDVDFSIPGGGFDSPRIPDIPIVTFPPGVVNPNQPKKIVLATNHGVYYSVNFDSDSPNWQAMNFGLPDATLVAGLTKTPSGALYVGVVASPGSYPFQSIYRASGIGASWVRMFDASEYPQPSNNIIVAFGANPLENDTVAIHGGRKYSWPYDGNGGAGMLKVFKGGSLTHTSSTTIGNYRDRFGAIVFAANHWNVLCNLGFVFSGTNLIRYDSGGEFMDTELITGAAGDNSFDRYGVAGGAAEPIFYWSNSGYAGYGLITNAVTTWKTNMDLNFESGFSISPSGKVGLGCNNYSVPYKTTDGGATWNVLTGTLPTGSTVWKNCNDDNRWIFGGGSTLRLTMDQGAAYLNKIGDLYTLDPTVNIRFVEYME